jgi:hypothetical protein
MSMVSQEGGQLSLDITSPCVPVRSAAELFLKQFAHCMRQTEGVQQPLRDACNATVPRQQMLDRVP